MKQLLQQLSHGACRVPWLSSLLTLLFAGIYIIYGPAPATLVYDRAAISNGELWRLLSGHLVHCDLNHLLLNCTAFFILAALIEHQSRKLIPTTLFGIVSVSLYLWIFEAQLTHYCGLSGILNTLLVVALADRYKRTKNLIFPLTLAAAFVKICWEITTAEAIFSSTLWQSVPASHAAGYAGGVLLLVIYRFRPYYFLHNCFAFSYSADKSARLYFEEKNDRTKNHLLPGTIPNRKNSLGTRPG